MDVGDWITLGAVIVALSIGVASILHTRSLQKKERKESLLNEIIYWITRVITWRSRDRHALRDIVSSTDIGQSNLLMYANICGVKDEFIEIMGFSEYIGKVARRLNQGLPEAIEKLISDVKTYTDFLEVWQAELENAIKNKNFNITDKNNTKADNLATQMDKSANDALEVITNIKLRGIS